MSEIADRVRAHPFVQDLDGSLLDGFVDAVAGDVAWGPDQVVVRTGLRADRLYLIESGDVAIEVHQPGREPRIIQTVHGGDVFGWSWLFEPYRWTFDARTLSATTALAVDGDALRAALAADHELGYRVLLRFAEIVADRLEATRLQLMDLYGDR